jgi:hypothetical protein
MSPAIPRRVIIGVSLGLAILAVNALIAYHTRHHRFSFGASSQNIGLALHLVLALVRLRVPLPADWGPRMGIDREPESESMGPSERKRAPERFRSPPEPRGMGDAGLPPAGAACAGTALAAWLCARARRKPWHEMIQGYVLIG